jgi:hypothetical protein
MAVVFFKLSRLLNQEDALSAPYLDNADVLRGAADARVIEPVQGQAGLLWQDSAGVGSWFHSSTVFAPCPGRGKVILVTMAVLLLPYRAGMYRA